MIPSSTSGGIWNPQQARTPMSASLLLLTSFRSRYQTSGCDRVHEISHGKLREGGDRHHQGIYRDFPTGESVPWPCAALLTYVQDYASSPSDKWKSKDTAIYLLTSIASRGSTQQVSPARQVCRSLILAWCHINKSSCGCRGVLWPECLRRSTSSTWIGPPYPYRRCHQIPSHLPQSSKFSHTVDVAILTIAAYKRPTAIRTSSSCPASQFIQLCHFILRSHHDRTYIIHQSRKTSIVSGIQGA